MKLTEPGSPTLWHQATSTAKAIGPSAASIREPSRLIEEASALIRQQGVAEAAALNESVTTSTWRVGGLMLLAVFLGTIACVIVLVRSVVRPTQTLIGQMHKLGEGDLSDPATLIRQDEFGSTG